MELTVFVRYLFKVFFKRGMDVFADKKQLGNVMDR